MAAGASETEGRGIGAVGFRAARQEAQIAAFCGRSKFPAGDLTEIKDSK